MKDDLQIFNCILNKGASDTCGQRNEGHVKLNISPDNKKHVTNHGNHPNWFKCHGSVFILAICTNQRPPQPEMIDYILLQSRRFRMKLGKMANKPLYLTWQHQWGKLICHFYTRMNRLVSQTMSEKYLPVYLCQIWNIQWKTNARVSTNHKSLNVYFWKSLFSNQIWSFKVLMGLKVCHKFDLFLRKCLWIIARPWQNTYWLTTTSLNLVKTQYAFQ